MAGTHTVRAMASVDVSRMVIVVVIPVIVEWIIAPVWSTIIHATVPEWIVAPSIPAGEIWIAIPAAVVPWVIESAISIPRIPIESAVVSVIWIPWVEPCIVEPWIITESIVMIVRRVIRRHVRAVAEIPAVED